MFDYNLRINKKACFRMTLTRWILLGLTGFGLLIMLYRLLHGLGAVTNLSDEWPWGFWIYCDLILSALGACGFAVGILGHVLHIPEFRPLGRRALLMSFFCYVLVFLVLFIEIGRWDNFYWFFVSFAWTSPLYEVAICITLYLILQFLELVEVWGDRYKRWVKVIVGFFMPVIVLLACILPFGQEAAYGAIYLAMPAKLNPIWYSQYLPWACLITSFSGGLCFVALEYRLVNRHYCKNSDDRVIIKALRIAGGVIIAYLVVKLIDLSVRGVWGEVFSGQTEGNMFLLETIVGFVIPAVIVFTPSVKKPVFQMIAAACGVAGILLNRFNFIFTGMADYAGVSYTPKWTEIWIVIGLASLMILCYLFALENLPVVSGRKERRGDVVSRPPIGRVRPTKGERG
ncbi:MAG: NrfD/PsrC family molybdoenzyme membrane anchor subunit [Bacillota bacterium]|jgi:Ni/Fe-hydrogenase subunit HybB-like protein